MGSTKELYEICQFSNLTLTYDFHRVGGEDHLPIHSCNLTISDAKTTETIVNHHLQAHASKKELKNLISSEVMRNPPDLLVPFIETRRRGRPQEPIEDNLYIQWGRTLLNEYTLYVNDVLALNLFQGPNIAVDSEGFPQYGGHPLMIQLADDRTVAIFDYQRFHETIAPFLLTKRLIMCAAQNDLRMLNITTPNYVDIQEEYRERPEDLPKSLKTLAGEMVHREFRKPHGLFYMYDKWRVDTMDDYHRIYAATDAIATYKLFTELN